MNIEIIENKDSELRKLFLEYKNWYDLGRKSRILLDDVSINKKYPNDYDLGRLIDSVFSNRII